MNHEEKTLEFYILFSPGAGVLQSCVVHKIAVHLFFHLVFCGARAYRADFLGRDALPGQRCTDSCQRVGQGSG